MVYKLGDLVTVSSNNYSQKDDWEKFIYLDTSNLTDNVVDQVITYNNYDELPSRARQKTDVGNILFSSVRPNQKHYGYFSEKVENLLVSTGFIILKPKVNYVCGKYIYYFLTQDTVIGQLQTIAESSKSSYPAITNNDLLELQIDLPSLDEQLKIVNILSMLEKQIAQNNAMVKKLQVLAQSTFHYFFAKFTSKKMPLSTFIIEQKKSVLQVNEVEETNGIIPFFTSGDTIKYIDENLVDGFNLFLNTGGNASVKFYYGKASYSTDTWCLSAKNNMQFYIYEYLKMIENQMDGLYFHGTGLKHLQKPLFLKTEIPVPTENISKYNTIVEPIFRKISDIKEAAIKLESLKNKLLPLLINSQLT